MLAAPGRGRSKVRCGLPPHCPFALLCGCAIKKSHTPVIPPQIVPEQRIATHKPQIPASPKQAKRCLQARSRRSTDLPLPGRCPQAAPGRPLPAAPSGDGARGGRGSLGQRGEDGCFVCYDSCRVPPPSPELKGSRAETSERFPAPREGER